MKTTKKWWVISLAVVYCAKYPEDRFNDKDYHLTFASFDSISKITIEFLLEKFHEFSCDMYPYELTGQEEKCNCNQYFIDANENAKITFAETENGSRIDILTNRIFTTELIFNCLNSDGGFDLEEAKEMASIISADILKILE